jgi:hypothetical protein
MALGTLVYYFGVAANRPSFRSLLAVLVLRFSCRLYQADRREMSVRFEDIEVSAGTPFIVPNSVARCRKGETHERLKIADAHRQSKRGEGQCVIQRYISVPALLSVNLDKVVPEPGSLAISALMGLGGWLTVEEKETHVGQRHLAATSAFKSCHPSWHGGRWRAGPWF